MADILLVEDNEDNREMLARRLRRKGWDVVAVASGEQAIAATERQRFDVILMDMGLPGIDGWETTRTIRRAEEGHTPIIALTAHALKESRTACYQAGCDGFETKPVNFERLVATIVEIVGKSDDT